MEFDEIVEAYKRGYIDAQHPYPSCPQWYADREQAAWLRGWAYYHLTNSEVRRGD